MDAKHYYLPGVFRNVKSKNKIMPGSEESQADPKESDHRCIELNLRNNISHGATCFCSQCNLARKCQTYAAESYFLGNCDCKVWTQNLALEIFRHSRKVNRCIICVLGMREIGFWKFTSRKFGPEVDCIAAPETIPISSTRLQCFYEGFAVGL